MPTPLKAGTRLAEGAVSRDKDPFGKRIGKKAWVFWLDLAPYAGFQHDSKLLLVNDANGKVLRNVKYTGYPIINGKKAVWLRSVKNYQAKKYRVYTNLRDEIPADKAPRIPNKKSKILLAKKDFKFDCLIKIGLRNDPLFDGDFVGMTKFARSVGLRGFDAGIGGDSVNAGGAELKANVNWLTENENCKDILVFISGHGYEKGVPAINTGPHRPGKPTTLVTATHLKAMMKENPDTTFKFKINGCFSGRFVEALKKSPNLLVLETAADVDEYSWGPLRFGKVKLKNGKVRQIKLNRINPGYSEFVNGNITGMRKFASSATEIKTAKNKGGSLLARMIERSHTLGKNADAARTAGITHPQLLDKIDDFVVTGKIGYKHFKGYSVICLLFGTKPAQLGANYMVALLEQASLVVPVDESPNGKLDDRLGLGSNEFEISSYGTYIFRVKVTNPKTKKSHTITLSVVVTEAPGNCPTD